MDKFEFIESLLENRKLTSSQRDKIVQLASKELKSDIEISLSLNNTVESIENKQDMHIDFSKKLNSRLHNVIKELKKSRNFDNVLRSKMGEIEKEIENLKTQEPSVAEKRKKKPEPNPKHVAEFMSLFNHRDGFKYLTHNYDEDGNFIVEDYLKKTYGLFEIKTDKELNIPTSLWRIVKEFAFDSKQTKWWSRSKDYSNRTEQKIGWASKELRDWSYDNKLHPIRNEKFEAVINNFKRITRIEKNNLKALVDRCLHEVLGDSIKKFEIVKKNLEKADFYTHVQYLKDSLIEIFKEIVKRTDSKEKNRIDITYQRSTTEKYFLRKLIITHFNSFPNKELALLNKELRNDKGMMGNVNKKIQGYCYWSVETIIEDKPTRVNILKESNTPDYEYVNQAEGFKHIFTFYYKP